MTMGYFAYAQQGNRLLAAPALDAQKFAVVGIPFDGALNAVRARIESEARRLMARHHCVFFGGDHSVTLPLLRAARQGG